MTKTTQMQDFQGVSIQTPAVDVTKRGACLFYTFSTFGNSKKVNMSQIDIKNHQGELDQKVNKSQLRASKSLLESPQLEAIRSFDRQIAKYLDTISLPFDKSIVMVPLVLSPEVDQKLKDFAVRREALVQEFLNAYPAACQKAAAELSSVYNPRDYPPVSEIAKKFGFTWRFMSFSTPESLREVSPELYEAEKQKAAEQMREATQEMQMVLRESFAQLVEHMSERLKYDENGKPLAFHATTLSKLTEFLGNFDFRNLTDDKSLAEVVEKARGLMTGAAWRT